MSGFFAIRRQTWEQAAGIDAIGYKIALELYVKGNCSRPAEVPIRFAARAAGASKLTIRQQLQYLWHLAKLYRFRFPVAGMIALAAVSVTCLLVILLVVRWLRPAP
jgi:dolichol-phosphate mannosyltransferase